MSELYKMENLLGVGSFDCRLESPVQGIYNLTSADGTFSLRLIDTAAWFSDYDYSEIIPEIEYWTKGMITAATTLNSNDGDLLSAVTNLAGPLIIDWKGKRIRQFVLHSGKYPFRMPLILKGKVD